MGCVLIQISRRSGGGEIETTCQSRQVGSWDPTCQWTRRDTAALARLPITVHVLTRRLRHGARRDGVRVHPDPMHFGKAGQVGNIGWGVACGCTAGAHQLGQRLPRA